MSHPPAIMPAMLAPASPTPFYYPLSLAERLRSLPAEAAADLVVALDPRIARLVLCALHGLVREDLASASARDHDEVVTLMLQIAVGIFDHAVRDARGGRVFAVSGEVRGAVDRVIAARLAYLLGSQSSALS